MRGPQRLVPAVQVVAVAEQPREGIADEAPLLEVGPALERDPKALRDEAGHAEKEEHAEDGCVLGLALDADAVGPKDVSAHQRPTDAEDEEDPGGVADERIRL